MCAPNSASVRAGRAPDRARIWSALSSRQRVEVSGIARTELPAARGPGTGSQRTSHPPLEEGHSARHKKNQKTSATDCLSRRKWTGPATASPPDMVTSEPHTGATVSLQLEDDFSRRVHHAVEFQLSDLSRSDPRPAQRGIFQTTAETHSRKSAADVELAASESQPFGAAIHG